MPFSKLILKPGKDKAIKNHHHWIFSGAISSIEKTENGSFVQVLNSEKQLLGHAYVNTNSSITARMVNFNSDNPEKSINDNIEKAIKFRQELFKTKDTNAYRLINSEGDFLPGLIVDQYHDILVLQIATLGMEKLKPLILEILKKHLSPKAIFEKSNLPVRREEGLQNFEGELVGEVPDLVEIKEYGNKFLVNIKQGQKTGLFLDQREMRKMVGEWSKGKKILNCFGYTGGFSIFAARGGAKQSDTLDISENAINLAKENFKVNNLDIEKNNFIAEDVFEFLRKDKIDYDFIILDPPAFAKRKTDIVQACRGYKEINRLAMQKIITPGFLLTCSCSHFVDEKLFQQVIFQAATEAGKNVQIIGKHILAPDHPINIFHPEGNYLKSLFLFVD